ncbi:MAG: AAA family ATPase, partial [Euryarchaeota archaeon HGW-Euryarchaeota-1]
PWFVDFNALDQKDPGLADKLLSDPETVLYFFNKAVSEMSPMSAKENRIYARFKNVPDSRLICIRDLRSKHLHRLVKVRGLIKSSTPVRPQTTEMIFECPNCGAKISVIQTGQKITIPTVCECGRRGQFKELEKRFIDVEHIILEESPDEIEGTQAQKISVLLKDDLVASKLQKSIQPGSKIEITGALQEVPIILTTGGRSVHFDFQIDVNYVLPIEYEFEDIVISPEDEKLIKETSADPELLKKFRESIAPSIYGYNTIKEALVLQLFGGVRTTLPDETIRRGDSHILLIGDPGVGKSMLLMHISTLAPKARYVSGKATTGAGLTATVIRDEVIGGYALEAGALALTNKGIVLIDEFDKMSEDDRSAMHEAMEQQTISVSKANIQATLKAQTTVLAAANPKFGRFDSRKSLVEQLNIPDTLISRFDLIFIIQDIPNKVNDSNLAEHILNVHIGKESVFKTPFNTNFIRKYIAYARTHIHPELTPEAMFEIKDFFTSLRARYDQQQENEKTIPISARQLEAIIRLAQAAAKMRLSQKVEASDARISIDLEKYSLRQVGYDYETNQYDIDKVIVGSTAHQRSQNSNFTDELLAVLKLNRTIERKDIETIANKVGIEKHKADKIVDDLKREGRIFEPSPGKLQEL